MFSEQELAYLQAQPLARIATVDNDGQPTVVVVGFQFDGALLHQRSPARDDAQIQKYCGRPPQGVAHYRRSQVVSSLAATRDQDPRHRGSRPASGTPRPRELPRDYPSCLLELGYRRAGVRAGPGRPQKNQMAMRNTLVIQSLAGLKK